MPDDRKGDSVPHRNPDDEGFHLGNRNHDNPALRDS